MMISQLCRAERTPDVVAVTDWVQVIQKFPHTHALVVFDSYYIATVSLIALNPSISPTDSESFGPVAKTKLNGAVRKDRLPVTEGMDGRGDCPDEWK